MKLKKLFISTGVVGALAIAPALAISCGSTPPTTDQIDPNKVYTYSEFDKSGQDYWLTEWIFDTYIADYGTDPHTSTSPSYDDWLVWHELDRPVTVYFDDLIHGTMGHAIQGIPRSQGLIRSVTELYRASSYYHEGVDLYGRPYNTIYTDYNGAPVHDRNGYEILFVRG